MRQANIAEQARSVLGQRTQQSFELRTNPLDFNVTEAIAQEQVLDFQPFLVGADHQVHREVGDPAAADFGKAQLALLAAFQGAVHRVVLEHDDAVEQALATLPGPALNVGQRRVLVVAHHQVVVLQVPQPLAQRLLRVEGLDHRQGVDEQAKHVLGTGQPGRATRHRGAERDAALTAVALQQQQPRALHQGIERHALTLGKGVQFARRFGVEVAVHHAVPGACGTRSLGQNGRLLKQRQALTPKAFGLHPILTLQPGDVVSVAPGQGRQAVVVIQAQHVTQQP